MKSPVQPARLGLCLVATCLALSSSARAEDDAGPTTGPSTEHRFAVDRWTEKEQKIVDALNQPLSKPLGFVDTPLSEVIAVIAEPYQFQIMPDQRSLEDAQINLDEETVSIELTDVTLRSALNLILERFELAYVIDDEVMQILWEDDAENRLTTVVYDVRPLLNAGYTEIHLIQLLWTQTSGPWFPDDPNKRIENVVGGLSARQTRKVHDEIEALLQNLLKLAQRPPGDKPRAQASETDESAPATSEEPAGETAPTAAENPSNTSPSATFQPAWMKTVVYDVEDLAEAEMSASDIAHLMPTMLTEIYWADDTGTPDDKSEDGMAGLPEGCRWTMPVTMGSWTIMLDWVSPSITGRVEPVGKRLSVVQTPEGHEAVRRFLAALRAAVAAGPQDGVTAHPLQPWDAYPGPVGNGITANLPWQVVVYNVASLTKVGYEPASLNRAVRKTVRPNDWKPIKVRPLHTGGLAFCVPSIPLDPAPKADEVHVSLGGSMTGAVLKAQIEPLGKTLVVYQARFVHESIESFLQELHQTHRDERK